jgi:hypothetical protein
MPTIGDPAGADMVVSGVLNDVLSRQRVREHKQLRPKYRN